MSKPTSTTASPSDIQKAVEKEDDFGHEMRVGHILKNVSELQSQHGGTYTDRITQKPRQFDFRCWLIKQTTSVALAIECKNLSPSVPLVVCGKSRPDDEAFHEIIYSRKGTFTERGSIVSGNSSKTLRASRGDSFYKPDYFVGKSLVRFQIDRAPIVRMNDSDIYDKWAQALSSAVELAESSCIIPSTLPHTQFSTVVLPIVVVPDGVLWIVSYDDSGNISAPPAQTNDCEFFIGREIGLNEKSTPWFHQFSFSHVHFLTISGFNSFLSKIASDTSTWERLFTNKAVEVL